MDPVRSMPGIFGTTLVGERNAHRNKGGEAFQQALREHANAREGDGEAAAQQASRNVRPARPVPVRKPEDEGRHVDVFA